MAQKVDLYSILSFYVAKNNSPWVDPEAFLMFLERHAKKTAVEFPEWNKWKDDTRAKFNAELSYLAEEGRVELPHETANNKIYLTQYFIELVYEYYTQIENNADRPFPCEESLEITLPENQYRSLGATELTSLLDEPPDSLPPLLRIGFVQEYGTALVPSDYLPQRLVGVCLIKFRNYLRGHGNKEYAQNKLTTQLAGKEAALKDILNRILLRPLDCIGAIIEGGEFSYLFWAHFCVLVKNEIKKKQEPVAEDTAVIQAIFIIETLNIFYKTKAAKARDKELAFKRLEQCLSRPPYLYSLEQIIKFTNSKGILLVTLFTREELAERIKKLTNEGEGKLPELLVLAGEDNERYFVMKEKILLLGTRLIIEARDRVKRAVSKYWFDLLKNYRNEPAMTSERDFEKTLYRFTDEVNPILNSLLHDPKFQLVYEEMNKKKEIPAASAFFENGTLIPYSRLYILNRKDLLTDAKFLLPFWYSIPALVSVIRFFKKITSIKTNDEYLPGAPPVYNDDYINAKKENREIQNAARELEYVIVPKHHTMETYLNELESEWSRVINEQARANLIEDVNSLIRHNLRQIMRVQRHYKVNRQNLAQLAEYILATTPSLKKLRGQESLKAYIELYLVKLIENEQFSKLGRF